MGPRHRGAVHAGAEVTRVRLTWSSSLSFEGGAECSRDRAAFVGPPPMLAEMGESTATDENHQAAANAAMGKLLAPFFSPAEIEVLHAREAAARRKALEPSDGGKSTDLCGGTWVVVGGPPPGITKCSSEIEANRTMVSLKRWVFGYDYSVAQMSEHEMDLHIRSFVFKAPR